MGQSGITVRGGKGAGQGPERLVPVLVDSPEDFAPGLLAAGLTPLAVTEVGELAEALRGRAVSGFILDLDRVQALRGVRRENVWQLAEAFPLLRVRRDHGGRLLLDDPERFLTLARAFEPRPARLSPRTPMLRPAEIASRDDAAFIHPRPFMLLDLSATGARVSGPGPLPEGGVLRLRLSAAARPLPGCRPMSSLAAEVRWRVRRADGRNCAGVRFLGRLSA